MILPVILDEGDILHPLYCADTVCKFHIGIFAEYLYRHLGIFAPHGLGFDRILDAPQRPDDVVSVLDIAAVFSAALAAFCSKTAKTAARSKSSPSFRAVMGFVLSGVR